MFALILVTDMPSVGAKLTGFLCVCVVLGLNSGPTPRTTPATLSCDGYF
jgi:hypothetical protein